MFPYFEYNWQPISHLLLQEHQLYHHIIINLSSEEILSGSFIVFAEDVSNLKAFFLEVEHEGISGLKTQILHILTQIQHILTGRLINLQLQDWWTFHQNSDTEHSTSTFRSV